MSFRHTVSPTFYYPNKTGATGVSISASVFSPATRWNSTSAAGGAVTIRPSRPFLSPSRLLALSTDHQSSDTTPFMEETECDGVSLTNFFELARDLVGSSGRGGGPPRWFSPLECSSQLDNSPMLLYLPGIDGTGAGLALQYKQLSKMFDIWCLHIPVMDRTSFTGLVTMVERTIRSESNRFSNRPIYIVGESLGACIALAVAARNPNIDLVLILANPATSFDESPMKSLVPILEMIPDQIQLTQPLSLSLMRGDPFKVLRAASQKGMPSVQTLAALSEDILTVSSYISVLVDILPKGTLQWKLQMLKSASTYTNSRLHAVKAQILFLMSGKDQLLPSIPESSRLKRKLPNCEIRKFVGNGQFLFLEDDVNLATVIKGAGFYRHGKSLDYITDYLPPTFSEFTKLYEWNKVLNEVTGTVMVSTLEDGTIVRGLNGIPTEGPVLIVGYHMLLGIEVAPIVSQLLAERNIHVRGVAHPTLLTKHNKEIWPIVSFYDVLRLMGAVPVSGLNLFKLFKNKSHVLLYPGGGRESMHKKGEQYKLFWPEQAEFVRMAAKFGAKIVPFGAVGEDDFGEVVFDIDDLMKIPPLRDLILKVNQETPKLRTDATGEVAQQLTHLPGIMPKIPGRFYYYFGKPIDTEGWNAVVRDREKSHELYLEVKAEVERCLTYLQIKREKDPYRSIFSRLIYQAINGPEVQVPTFEL